MSTRPKMRDERSEIKIEREAEDRTRDERRAKT